MSTVKPIWDDGVNEWLRQIKLGHDILQLCSIRASHRVKDTEFENVIAVLTVVFAVKITHTQPVV